jgi:putative DNA primase/helicase
MIDTDTPSNGAANEKLIQQALQVLFQPNNLVEIRGRKLDKKIGLLGFHTDRTQMAHILSTGSEGGEYEALWYTIQRLKPDIDLRQKEENKKATDRTDILSYEWLVIDVDRKDEEFKKLNATDEELAELHRVALLVIAWLQSKGFPEPILACSGNGWHILYKLNHLLPTEEYLLKNVLRSVWYRFIAEPVAVIDTSLAEPEQVIKAYNTQSRKTPADHPDIGTRPWRFSYLESVPSEIIPVSHTNLESVAAIAPPVTHTKRGDMPPLHDDFDSEEFFEWYEGQEAFRITGETTWQGRPVKITDHCIMVGHKHTGSGLTGFIVGDTFGYHCFSDDCTGVTISDVLRKLADEGFEAYPGAIWNKEPLLETVEWEDVVDEPPAPVPIPIDQKKGKHGLTPEGEAAYEARKQKMADLRAEIKEAEQDPEPEPEPEPIAPSETSTVIYAAHSKELKQTASITGHLASTVTPVPIRWIWPERFPAGKLALLNGPQGSGKSMLFVDIIAHVTTGKDWHDCKNTLGPKKVLLASTEDDEKDTIIPRLMAAGADLNMVIILDKVRIEEMIEGNKAKSVMLNLKAHTKLIKGLLRKHPDVALILLDPITAFLGVDETRDKDTRPVLESLADAMSGTLATLIGIIHSNKMTKGSAGDKVKGGSSMLGVVRTAWAVGRDPEDKNQRYMALIKGNVLKKESGLKFTVENKVLDESTGLEAGYIEWGEEMDENANDMLSASRSKAEERVEPKDSKLEAAKTLLLRELKDDGWRLLADIHKVRKKENISEGTLKRARYELGIIYDGGKGHKPCKIALAGTEHEAEPVYPPEPDIPGSEVL